MRIALINENSQAAKNELIYKSLKKVADARWIITACILLRMPAP